MIIKRLVLQQLSLISTATLIFFNFFVVSTAAYSQSLTKNNNSNSGQQNKTSPNNLPELPENGSPTGRREGGASRNSCPILSTNLTAIVPGVKEGKEKSSSKSFLAATISEYPTFWVYIPSLTQRTLLGEFIIQNEVGEDIYRQSLTLPKKAGIVGVKAPSVPQYALTLDQKYHWYFRVFCDRRKTQSEYIYVDAWIQRVSLGSQVDTQLTTNKPENYLDFVDYDIWYDGLTNLAMLRDRDPQNNQYKNDWTNLLQLLGLENLAQEAVLFRYDREL
jgi:hypothetical protein